MVPFSASKKSPLFPARPGTSRMVSLSGRGVDGQDRHDLVRGQARQGSKLSSRGAGSHWARRKLVAVKKSRIRSKTVEHDINRLARNAKNHNLKSTVAMILDEGLHDIQPSAGKRAPFIERPTMRSKDLANQTLRARSSRLAIRFISYQLAAYAQHNPKRQTDD